MPEWFEIALDSCSQVNIVNPRFLTNNRPGDGEKVGLSGTSSATKLIGDLEEFFPCMVCDTCAASVLSMRDVEAIYPITYIKGLFTVHMANRDLTFYERDGLYLADFRDWITAGGLSMMTVAEREAMYTRKQLSGAQRAGEFIENAGYPSQGEALKLIRDGNIKNIPVEALDVKLFYEIYCEPIPSIRGKATADKGANMKDTYDPGLKLQITEKSLTTDIMTVSGVNFVVSLAEPLNIIISSYVPSLGQVTLGRALKGHLDCLEMFGFHARMTRVDPLKALAALRGRFQGMEIDISGAGDHLPAVDIRIRRIKELARSTIASLKFDMPTSFIRYLITYCVSRINVRTGASGGNVSP